MAEIGLPAADGKTVIWRREWSVHLLYNIHNHQPCCKCAQNHFPYYIFKSFTQPIELSKLICMEKLKLEKLNNLSTPPPTYFDFPLNNNSSNLISYFWHREQGQEGFWTTDLSWGLHIFLHFDLGSRERIWLEEVRFWAELEVIKQWTKESIWRRSQGQDEFAGRRVTLQMQGKRGK